MLILLSRLENHTSFIFSRKTSRDAEVSSVCKSSLWAQYNPISLFTSCQRAGIIEGYSDQYFSSTRFLLSSAPRWPGITSLTSLIRSSYAPTQKIHIQKAGRWNLGTKPPVIPEPPTEKSSSELLQGVFLSFLPIDLQRAGSKAPLGGEGAIPFPSSPCLLGCWHQIVRQVDQRSHVTTEAGTNPCDSLELQGFKMSSGGNFSCNKKGGCKKKCCTGVEQHNKSTTRFPRMAENADGVTAQGSFTSIK